MRSKLSRVAGLLASAVLFLGAIGLGTLGTNEPVLAGAAQLSVCPSGCSYTSVRAALNAARPGDTIEIQPGTYNEHLKLSKNVTLDGPGAILDGGGAATPGSVIIVERGVTATLQGLTITDGYSPDFGGGILNYGRLTLEGDQIVGNVAAGNGGGIYNNGVLTLQDSQVTGNSAAGLDGGIDNDTGTVNVAGSVVANNAPSNCASTPAVSTCQD